MAIAHSLTLANHPSRSRQYQLQAERIYMSKLAVLKTTGSIFTPNSRM